MQNSAPIILESWYVHDTRDWNSHKSNYQKTPKAKDIVSLNSAKQAASSLIALASKTSDCVDSFSTMEEMLRYRNQQIATTKKDDAKDSSEEEFGEDNESEEVK